MDSVAERIAGLERYVRETTGFERWVVDSTPSSLEELGTWFVGQVETHPRATDELDEIRAKLVFPVDVPSVELTNKTFSLAFDIGMYLGQVIWTQHPRTKWDLPLSSPRYVNYGQPVLVGAGKVPLNPVGVVVTLAYGIAKGKRDGARLRVLYDNWVEMLWP